VTTGTLLRSAIRRDRVTLSMWILGTALLALFAASAVGSTYDDEAERVGILRLAVDNPAILLLRGLPHGTSLPAFVFFQIFTWLALLAGLMSSFLAVRHTRAEEESGRAELVAATPAARTAPTIAAIAHGLLANLVMGASVAAALVAGGMPVAGSLVTGGAVAAVGVAFLAVGLLAAQFARTSRGANTLGVGAVCLAFLLRGLGDALGTPSADGAAMVSAWPSWLSPVGWGQHVFAYTDDDPRPLLLCLALATACTSAVLALQAGRDSGASLLPARAGRAGARPWLRSAFALGWRLHWPTLVAWCAGGAAFGLFAGGLSGVVVRAAKTDPDLAANLRTIVPSGGSVTQVLIAAMFALVGVIAAGSATQAVIRLRQEEAHGTAELLLSTPLGRVRWLGGCLALGALSIALVLASGAAASSVAVLAASDDPQHAADSLAAAAAQLPAALVYLAVLALLFVLLPSAVSAVGWALLGAGVFLGVFGGLLGVPQWARDLSPFTHTPVVSGEGTDLGGAVWMLVIGAGAASAALVLMRHRELHG
jgi:ABC-2 type transport system permease protein